jgi:Ca-activated chloride channel homolog
MPSVTRSRWTVRALGVVALASVFSLAVVAASPRQSANVPAGNRSMFVSVVDKDGTPVPGLTPADFTVREDKVAREVLSATKATGPITLALLVDTSAAASPFIADMRQALTAFVKRMGGKNPISVVGFGDRPTVLTDYTLDVLSVQKAVDRVFATQGSGSYMLEAVDDSCKALNKRDFERAVMLTITAGGAEFSDRNYEDFVRKLPDCGATVSVMSFDIRPPDMSDWGQRNREQFIDAATRLTGGTRYPLLSGMAIVPQMSKFADELENEYRITYFRPDRLIPPEKIEVSVKRPGLTARGTPVKVKQGPA